MNRSKQIKKKIDIYEALISEGYDIGYTTVCVIVMYIKRREREAFIRQEYSPGKTVEFDLRRSKTNNCRSK